MSSPSFVQQISYSRTFPLPNGETEEITIVCDPAAMEEVDFINLRETTVGIVAKISEAIEKGHHPGV